MELPPETIKSTLDEHNLINNWMDVLEIYDSPRAAIHDLLDRAVKNAHMFALASAGSRILTVADIADRLGISVKNVRKRLAQASPPILPVKTIGLINLYMIEDLPAIAHAHMQGVIEDGENTRYVTAKLRATIAAVKHKSTVRRLAKDAGVRWPDIDGTPRVIKVPVARQDAAFLEINAKSDGWEDTEHLLRAFIVSYNEISRRKGR